MKCWLNFVKSSQTARANRQFITNDETNPNKQANNLVTCYEYTSSPRQMQTPNLQLRQFLRGKNVGTHHLFPRTTVSVSFSRTAKNIWDMFLGINHPSDPKLQKIPSNPGRKAQRLRASSETWAHPAYFLRKSDAPSMLR